MTVTDQAQQMMEAAMKIADIKAARRAELDAITREKERQKVDEEIEQARKWKADVHTALAELDALWLLPLIAGRSDHRRSGTHIEECIQWFAIPDSPRQVGLLMHEMSGKRSPYQWEPSTHFVNRTDVWMVSGYPKIEPLQRLDDALIAAEAAVDSADDASIPF